MKKYPIKYNNLMRIGVLFLAVFIATTFYRISQLKKDKDVIESEQPAAYENPVKEYLEEGEGQVKIEKIASTELISSFTDDRDGNQYKTAVIGDQTWIVENMNFKMQDATCYENLKKNCTQYGRLYNWSDAQLVCPLGWHLPSDSDWNKLYSNLGRNPIAAYEAMTNGESRSFNARFGGWQNNNGVFNNIGSNAYFWSNTSVENDFAHYYMLSRSAQQFMRTNTTKKVKLSCRCIKDEK